MKIYLIDNEYEARQISQLMRLNSECAKLHWSKTISVPANILASLEAIESFIEEKIYAVCNEKAVVDSLSEDEESTIMALLRNNPKLRATLGLGVVMAGVEAEDVTKLLEKKDIPQKLIRAINSGKNVIIF